MNREFAYQLTLDAIAQMQKSIAIILEAKATEAEKVRNWLITHITTDTYDAHSEQLSACMLLHEQNIAVIDGLTKLCRGLSHNMKIILNPDEGESDDMSNMVGGFDSGDGDSKK